MYSVITLSPYFAIMTDCLYIFHATRQIMYVKICFKHTRFDYVRHDRQK